MRVVYIASPSPDPPLSGGALRIAAIERALRESADVLLLVLGDRPPLEARMRLRARGARVFAPPRDRPLAWVLRRLAAAGRGESLAAASHHSPRRVARLVAMARAFRPDVVLLGYEAIAPLAPAFRPLGARVVVDTHNVASRAQSRIARASPRLADRILYAGLALDTARAERRSFPLADEVWAVSREDADFYAAIPGVSRVEVVPNVVDVPTVTVGPGEPGAVAFLGSFSYWPNEDAALRLIRMAAPLRERGVLRELALVGVAPTERMRAAARGRSEIVITGRVADPGPWLDRAAVIAAPIAAGSGTKLKILEALARGRPVLTTPLGAEGLEVQHGVHARVVPLQAFEGALESMLADPGRMALGEAGRALVQEHYSTRNLSACVRERLTAWGAAS